MRLASARTSLRPQRRCHGVEEERRVPCPSCPCVRSSTAPSRSATAWPRSTSSTTSRSRRCSPRPTELEAPLIVQTSVKTVKSIGARALLHDVARAGRRRCRCRSRCTSTTARIASGSPTCLRDRLELGAVRRLRARRRREHAPDDRGGRRGRRLRRAGRGRDRERRRASRTASAPTRAARSTRSRCRRRSSRRPASTRSRRRSAPRTASTRPSPTLDARAGDRARRAAPDPDGAARRHRADRGAVHRPDRARLRQGQHLDGAEDRLRRRRTASTSTPNPGKHDPPSLLHARRARPSRRWPSTTSASSVRQGGVGDDLAAVSRARADLRLRRRARRHRARRPPARVQPDVRRGRPAGAAGPRRSTPRSCGSAAARSGWQPADRRVRARPTACPPTPRASGSCWPTGTGARPRSTRRWCAPGALPARPGIARIVDEALARRLDAGGRLDLGRGVGAGGARARRSAPSRPRASRVFAGDVVPGQEARPGHLPAGARAARASTRTDAIVVEDSRNGLLAAVGAGLRCVVTVSGYTERRGLRARRVLVVTSLGDPRRARARARQPQRRATRRPGDAGRPRGLPERTPARTRRLYERRRR